MRIKRLEIKGFKSFPDRTVLDFGPGVTCVVGPNGAGKSNILEALRWVMGEQRVKTLRSRKMEDVIFNGSETLKPVGLAEVRLVLLNANKSHNSAYNDYDEIMVTRRLFRDGASNYEINNVACRLSDITDFFLDTGVGRNSYAIIEQGRVEQIVAARPEDRRLLIEEAAGINKYKARKEVALKKLEATSQNLLRLSDIIVEVKSQSQSLRKQALKAQRYQKLMERLRFLEIALIVDRLNSWTSRLSNTRHNMYSLRNELQNTEIELAEKSAQLEKSRLEKLGSETDLRDALEKKHKLEMELGANRETAKRSTDRLADVKSRLENVESESALARKTRDKAIEDLASTDEDLAQTKHKLASFRDELVQAQKTNAELTDHISRNRKQFNNLRDELFRSLQDSALAKNKKESLLKRKSELERHISKKNAERSSLLQEIESANNNINLIGTKLSEVSESLTRMRAIQAQLSEEKTVIEASIRTSRSSVDDLEKKCTTTHTRLRTLEELQGSYDSYNSPIRFIMKNRNVFEKGAVFGPIAEIIDVPDAYNKALVATLRDRINMVVASSVRDSIMFADRLRLENTGRASFVPVEPRLIGLGHQEQTLKDAEPLMEVVSVRPGFESLARFLFEGVFIVENLHKAAEVWENNGIHVDMVTLEGDFLSRHGEVSGGSNHMVGEEIFSRRQEINRLQDQYRKLHGELEGAKLRLGQEDARLNEARVRLVKSSEEVNGLKMEELKLQALRDNHKNRLDSAERQMRSLEMDETRFQRETSQINEELKQSEELVESLNKKSAEIETQKDKLQSEINILHQKNSDRQSKIENLKIQSARLGERVRSSERELQSQQEKIAYSENQITRLNSEKQRAEELTVRLSEEIESLNEKEIYLMRSHEETVALVESVKSILAGLHGSCSGLELEVQEHNRSLRSIGQKLHELEVDSARLEENIRNAKDQIGDQAEPDPEKIRQEFGEISDTQLEAIKEKVSSFGPVNLAAISESKAVDERLEFLGNQETDLKKAVDTLHETIETINQTTRDRFMETFEKVNQQFYEIFPFLFGGGQGRLELTDSENPLETGVAIIVRPPGKRFQNMDLLSGGEKALTAVALIFSIFLISPSPFCLLDEVDAPLDDSNLSRFNSMLRKLSDRTQFIVVTHNKRSMEESDALFGVTMEEPGASKVVSVKFLN